MNAFAQQQTALRLRRFARCVRAAAKDPTNAEAIHDLRVANRRLTQCISAFNGFLRPEPVEQLRKRLKRLMDRCAAVRNCDVALEVLATCDFSADSKVAGDVVARRAKAERKLVKHLARWHKHDLPELDPQRLFNPEAVETEFTPGLAPWLEKWFADGDLAAAPEAPYETMHQFRLESKRLRYTLELLRPLLDPAAAQLIPALRNLQDALGHMNDCVATIELIHAHKRAVRVVELLLAERTAAFRTLWHDEFGKRRQHEWRSIFSATAKPNRAKVPSRKPAARSQTKAGATSAA